MRFGIDRFCAHARGQRSGLAEVNISNPFDERVGGKLLSGVLTSIFFGRVPEWVRQIR